MITIRTIALRDVDVIFTPKRPSQPAQSLRVIAPIKVYGEAEFARVWGFLATPGNTRESDRVIAAMTFRAGLTVTEIAQLATDDLFYPSGEIRPTVRAGGNLPNGLLSREVPMRPQLQEAVLQLYDRHPEATGVAFHRRPDGTLQYRSTGSLYSWFRRMYDTAGLYGCTALSGRYSFASGLFRVAGEAGISVWDIHRLLGYKNLESTLRHDRRPSPTSGAIHRLGVDKIPLGHPVDDQRSP